MSLKIHNEWLSGNTITIAVFFNRLDTMASIDFLSSVFRITITSDCHFRTASKVVCCCWSNDHVIEASQRMVLIMCKALVSKLSAANICGWLQISNSLNVLTFSKSCYMLIRWCKTNFDNRFTFLDFACDFFGCWSRADMIASNRWHICGQLHIFFDQWLYLQVAWWLYL